MRDLLATVPWQAWVAAALIVCDACLIAAICAMPGSRQERE